MIFESFTNINGNSFFQDKRNTGLMFAWFNQFKRTYNSFGVMYLVLLDLPCSEQFKWKNIVLGVIPGQKESSIKISNYLKPSVEKLLQFWAGVGLRE